MGRTALAVCRTRFGSISPDVAPFVGHRKNHQFLRLSRKYVASKTEHAPTPVPSMKIQLDRAGCAFFKFYERSERRA
jgi:hypothetical protein